MEISKEHIEKISERIKNFNNFLETISQTSPSDITPDMEASLYSLSKILDEFDLQIKIDKNGYMEYQEFYNKLFDDVNDSLYHKYFAYKQKYDKLILRNNDFYNNNIEYINKVFASKLR